MIQNNATYKCSDVALLSIHDSDTLLTVPQQSKSAFEILQMYARGEDVSCYIRKARYDVDFGDDDSLAEDYRNDDIFDAVERAKNIQPLPSPAEVDKPITEPLQSDVEQTQPKEVSE